MNFVTFIENRYQELTLKNQVNPYSAVVDSEVKAIHALLNGYRRVLKWLLIPKSLGQYFCVCLGFIKPPEPVMINKAKADRDAAEKKAEEAKVAQKFVLPSESGEVGQVLGRKVDGSFTWTDKTDREEKT